MAEFPEGARVRIGQREGTVLGTRVHVQFPDVARYGSFDPRFVHLIEAAAPNQTAAQSAKEDGLRHRIVRALWDAADICLTDEQLGKMADAVIEDVITPQRAHTDQGGGCFE